MGVGRWDDDLRGTETRFARQCHPIGVGCLGSHGRADVEKQIGDLDKLRKLTDGALAKVNQVRAALPGALDDGEAVASAIDALKAKFAALRDAIEKAIAGPLDARKPAAAKIVADGVAVRLAFDEPDPATAVALRTAAAEVVEMLRAPEFADVVVLNKVSEAGPLRLDQARNAVFTEHELDGWEFDVMSALRRAGEPFELSPGALVQKTLVTSGTMTNRVDGLERRGFVSRQPSPSDRRGVLVRLTPAGLRAVDAAFDALLHHERRLLAGMDDDARAHLAASLRTLLTAVES